MSPKPRPHMKWLNSYAKVSAWMQKVPPLQKLLKQGNGIVKISGIFPEEVAEGILSDLETVQNWNDTSADHDYSQNNIQHSFLSVRQGIEEAVRALSLLLPGELHSFSAAKYLEGNHIDPHDDRAYTQVLMDDGCVVSCSRTIAVIYYLTKDWRHQYGGLLVDMEAQGGPKTYVPEFNSAIAFRIPRWHLVTPMAPGVHRARYTLFGWFLKPGKLYDLQIHPPPAMPAQVEKQPKAEGAGAHTSSSKRAPKSKKRGSALLQQQQAPSDPEQNGSNSGGVSSREAGSSGFIGAGNDTDGADQGDHRHDDSDSDADGGGMGLVRLARVQDASSCAGKRGQAGGRAQNGVRKRTKLKHKW